jgi:AcrR family transcriptional regulator
VTSDTFLPAGRARLRRVAVELGIAPMSLYNYVPTKDHLIQLMIDLAGGEYRFPDPATADKRAAIADLARQGRDITRCHPWLPDAVRRPMVIGPNGLRYIDCFLGLLAGSGLDTATKMVIISLINGFAIMYGGMEATLASQQASTGVSPDQHQAARSRRTRTWLRRWPPASRPGPGTRTRCSTPACPPSSTWPWPAG